MFDEGGFVYFLGIGNVLYGILLIVTAPDLTQRQLELIQTTVASERIEVVWAGESGPTGLAYDLLVSQDESEADSVERVKRLLQDKGVTFRA